MDAWDRKDRGQGGSHGTDPVINYELYRRWPVTFRDWDSLKSFLTLATKFTRGKPAVIMDGVSTFNTAEEFFDRPHPLNLDVTIVASEGARSFKVRLTTRAHYRREGSHEKCFVSIEAMEPQQADPSQIWVADLVQAFDSLTDPLTLRQRLVGRPIVTKRTESEYYADRRAAKVRWQSWLLGILGGLVGGFLGPAIAIWAGIKH